MSARTAFVLSGGASLGAVQVGMLRALYERGVRPDLIIGTSVGALNGAFIAGRPASPSTALELADVWRSLRRADVFPVNLLLGLRGFLGQRSNLVPNDGLRAILSRHVQFDRLEHARTPLAVVATNVASGTEILLAEGPSRDAILASAAIPGIFPPVEWKGRCLMDGGVSNNTPISHALERGVERVYVLPTGTACALPEPPRGALATVLHAMTVLVMQRLILEIDALGGDERLVVLPPPCPLDVSPADFSRADEMMDRSYADASAYLDGLRARRVSRFHPMLHDHQAPAQFPVLG